MSQVYEIGFLAFGEVSLYQYVSIVWYGYCDYSYDLLKFVNLGIHEKFAFSIYIEVKIYSSRRLVFCNYKMITIRGFLYYVKG